MPRFSEQFIQQVAQATDIVDLVGQYVALKKRGHEFIGLCPFHDDKRPSMNVSPTKQIFKCFACGAGGGVFKFVELYEKLSFPEAIRTLAERANIPLPREVEAPPDAGMSKNDLVRVTTFAARLFRTHLLSAAGQDALAYAHSRGITDETIAKFGIGFAPEMWDFLLQAARREGISLEQLQATGLVVPRDDGNGCYDRFRNRLMFPIIDAAGNVIAFGARALAANERAKYLNSPEGPLYDKSSHLYALNWAREAISASGQAVVVEGYMDALIPHQAGVCNVVANLGTALTDRQVRLLSRYAREIVLIYDADAAGQAAAERSLEMFLQQQLHVRVASIPDGKDPCDYTLAHGGEALKALIDSAPDALEYVWGRRATQYAAAAGNLAAQRAIIQEFLRLVVSSGGYGAIDPVRRGQLAQHIAHLLKLSADEVQQQMRQLARAIPRATVPRQTEEQAPASATKSSDNLAQRHLLEVLLNRPDLLDGTMDKVTPDDFTDETLKRIAQFIWQKGLGGNFVREDVLATQGLSDIQSLLVDLMSCGERRGNFEQTLEGAVESMSYRRGRQQMQAQKAQGYSDETLRAMGRELSKADARRRPRIS